MAELVEAGDGGKNSVIDNKAVEFAVGQESLGKGLMGNLGVGDITTDNLHLSAILLLKLQQGGLSAGNNNHIAAMWRLQEILSDS